jgi:CHAT domain
MDESGFEYAVTVRDGKYVSAITRHGGQQTARVAEQEIELSPLHRETIRILQEWLSRWGVLSRVALQYDHLCVPDTFKVLGQYLYNAIFPDPVATGFDDAKREAAGRGAPLRVVLTFGPDGDGNDDLASFPWEFLYHPPGPLNEREGFYIGAETNLTLSRLLPFGDQRPELPPVGPPPLNVLFVLSTPESLEDRCATSLQIQVSAEQQADYAKDRGALKDFMGQFQVDASRLVVRNLFSWDSATIDSELRDRSYNIVHVVGVCRTRNGSGKIEIALPGADGCPVWEDARVLVDLLRPRPGRKPLGLVVLHLCEAKRSDYTATFERLAPSLVQAGIPAVLAMQYPVPTTAATSFTEKFYGFLIAGKEIGQAVQEARQRLLAESGGDRVFGTPVLYLQSVDGQLVRDATASGTGPTPDVQRGTSQTLADQLRSAVVDSRDLGSDTKRRFLEWIDRNDWTADRAELTQRILARQHDETDIARTGPLYRDMLIIVGEAGS